MNIASKHIMLTMGNSKYLNRVLQCMQEEYDIEKVHCGDSSEICLLCRSINSSDKPSACEILKIEERAPSKKIKTILYSLKEKNLAKETKDSQNCAFYGTSCKVRVRAHSVLNLLAEITDLRDSTTGNHILRITNYIAVLTNILKNSNSSDYRLSKTKAYEIVSTAKLHDLGKIAVPDTILLKPGRLTDEEFDIIKTHPEKGAKLLDRSSLSLKDDAFLNVAREIAMYHHEKWDGGGYPQGIKGKKIPLSARMVSLADTYDALTHARPYKPAFSHQYAVNVINKDSGTHFDPYLVDIFNQNSHHFQKMATQA